MSKEKLKLANPPVVPAPAAAPAGEHIVRLLKEQNKLIEAVIERLERQADLSGLQVKAQALLQVLPFRQDLIEAELEEIEADYACQNNVLVPVERRSPRR